MDFEMIKNILSAGKAFSDTFESVSKTIDGGIDAVGKVQDIRNNHKKSEIEIEKLMKELKQTDIKNTTQIEHYRKISERLIQEYDSYQEYIRSNPQLLVNKEIQDALNAFWTRLDQFNNSFNKL